MILKNRQNISETDGLGIVFCRSKNRINHKKAQFEKNRSGVKLLFINNINKQINIIYVCTSRELNPGIQLGRLTCYLYITGA